MERLRSDSEPLIKDILHSPLQAQVPVCVGFYILHFHHSVLTDSIFLEMDIRTPCIPVVCQRRQTQLQFSRAALLWIVAREAEVERVRRDVGRRERRKPFGRLETSDLREHPRPSDPKND